MATVSFTIVTYAGDATSITFTPIADKFKAPVVPGTKIGTVTVDPPDWTGAIVVDGVFAMSGMDVVVGATPLAIGSYTGNLTATP